MASDRREVIDHLAVIGRHVVSAPNVLHVRIATPVLIAIHVLIATRPVATPMSDATDVVVGIVSVAAVSRTVPPPDHRRRNHRSIACLAFRRSLME